MPAQQGNNEQSIAANQAATRQYLVFDKFETMDTQRARVALPVARLAWCENLQILAENQLVVVPSNVPGFNPQVGNVWFNMFPAAYNNHDYLIIFGGDGSARQYDPITHVSVVIAGPGTFSPTPDLTVWKNERVLIADATAGYVQWNGTVFAAKGTISPNINLTAGGNYNAGPPSVTITGGSGVGAVANTTLTGTAVTAVNVTNAGSGYLAADTLLVSFTSPAALGGVGTNFVLLNPGSGYTGAPAVTVTGGGASVQATGTATLTGSSLASITLNTPGTGYTSTPTVTIAAPPAGGTQAIAQLQTSTVAFATAKVWPSFTFSPNPTTIAVFQGRVWLGGGRILAWTGTGGFDDSSAVNASGSQSIPDADLIHGIFALRSLNNYLFIFGDNSVKQIGSISVTGTPASTQFTINTLASDVGTTFPRSIVSYNRLVLFANQIGVYAIFGASIEKISDPMDGIFENANFGGAPAQACVGTINSQKTFLCLIGVYDDPILNIARSILLAFSNKRWYVLSFQAPNLASLAALVTAATQGETLLYIGESGGNITQILAANNLGPVAVTLRTAMNEHKKPMLGKRVIRFGIGQQIVGPSNVTGSIDTEIGRRPFAYTAALLVTWLNAAGVVVTFINVGSQVVHFSGSGFEFVRNSDAAGSGIYLGVSLAGTFQATGGVTPAPLSFTSIVLEYQDATLMASSGAV